MATVEKPSKPSSLLRFRAGAVGFVFQEEGSFPGVSDGHVFAFGKIQDAAAWLTARYGTEPDNTDANTVQEHHFRSAERALLGQRWTPAEARKLRELISIGEVAEIRNG